MLKAKFGLEERMTAEVPRWAIAPVNKRQSVAEHQYFVALYASKICWMLGVDDRRTAAILHLALRHDVAEVRTSDIPGPIKKEVVDDKALGRLEDDFRAGCGLDYISAYQVDAEDANFYRAILKLADVMDEYLYLKMEMARGNSMLRPVFATVSDRLRQAARHKAFPDDFFIHILSVFGNASSQIDRGVILPDARVAPEEKT